jgi:mRNA interferase RelE/StbE
LKVEFNESFLKDIKSVKASSVLKRVTVAIESVEKATSLDKIPHLKKMRGSRDYFRIRIGDFRIGIKLESNTMVFVRLLNRKDIYRKFP